MAAQAQGGPAAMYSLTNVVTSDLAAALPLPSLPPPSSAAWLPGPAADGSPADPAIAALAARLLQNVDISYIDLPELPSTTPACSTGMQAAVVSCAPDAFAVDAVRVRQPSSRQPAARRAKLDAAQAAAVAPDDVAAAAAVAVSPPRPMDVSSPPHRRPPPPTPPKPPGPSPTPTAARRSAAPPPAPAPLSELVGDVISACDTADASESTIGPGDLAPLTAALAAHRATAAAMVAWGGAEAAPGESLTSLPEGLTLDSASRLLESLDGLVAAYEAGDDPGDDDDEGSPVGRTAIVGLEAACASLELLSCPGLPGSLRREEQLERCAVVARKAADKCIYPAVDPATKSLLALQQGGARGDGGGNDDDGGGDGGGEAASSPAAKKGKRAKPGGAAKSAKAAKAAKPGGALCRRGSAVAAVAARTGDLLSLLACTLPEVPLATSTLLGLCRTALTSLHHDALSQLQPRAVELLAAAFGACPIHRGTLTDDAMSLLFRSSPSRRGARAYHVTAGAVAAAGAGLSAGDGDGPPIMAGTALALLYVQASASLPPLPQAPSEELQAARAEAAEAAALARSRVPDTTTKAKKGKKGDKTGEKAGVAAVAPPILDAPVAPDARDAVAGVEAAQKCAAYFWASMLRRAGAPAGAGGSTAATGSTGGAESRAVVEAVMTDCLAVMAAPEWPAAATMLQALAGAAVGPDGAAAVEPTARAHAAELLGMVASALAADARPPPGGVPGALRVTSESLTPVPVTLMTPMSPTAAPLSPGGVAPTPALPPGWVSLPGEGPSVIGTPPTPDLHLPGALVDALVRQAAALASLGPGGGGASAVVGHGDYGDYGDDDDDDDAGCVPRCRPLALGWRASAQQVLLNHVAAGEAAATRSGGSSLPPLLARRFHLSQWYADAHGPAAHPSLQHGTTVAESALRSAWRQWAPAAAGDALATLAGGAGGSVPPGALGGPPLPRTVAAGLMRALLARRPLARSLGRLLSALASLCRDPSIGVRAKALKAVGAVIDADDRLLATAPAVADAVDAALTDTAASVREAALELVGAHMCRRPAAAAAHVETVLAMASDATVSVRKRCARLLRDCLSLPSFPDAPAAAVRLATTCGGDDESGIRDIAAKTFHDLWLGPDGTPKDGGGKDGVWGTRAASVARLLSDVSALRTGLPLPLPPTHPIAKLLQHALAGAPPTTAAAAAAKPAAAAAAAAASRVRRKCESLRDAVVESLLSCHEQPPPAGRDGSSSPGDDPAAGPALALHALTAAMPSLSVPPSAPAKLITLLAPYLQPPPGAAGPPDGAVALQCHLAVIECAMRQLSAPGAPPGSLPPTTAAAVRRDTSALLSRSLYHSVINASARALAALASLPPPLGGAAVVIGPTVFWATQLDKAAGEEAAAAAAGRPDAAVPMALRSLFNLGSLVRWAPDALEAAASAGAAPPAVAPAAAAKLMTKLLTHRSFAVKKAALQALGFVWLARPSLLQSAPAARLLSSALSPSAAQAMREQALLGLTELLHEEETRLFAAQDAAAGDTAVGDGLVSSGASGAIEAETVLSGEIVRRHWGAVLSAVTDPAAPVRYKALAVIAASLRQGLVLPASCVPHLVALECDPSAPLRRQAHGLLVSTYSKYPALVDSRLPAGLLLACAFRRRLGGGGGAGLESQRSLTASVLKRPGQASPPPATTGGDDDGMPAGGVGLWVSAEGVGKPGGQPGYVLALEARAASSAVYGMLKGGKAARRQMISSLLRPFSAVKVTPGGLVIGLTASEAVSAAAAAGTAAPSAWEWEDASGGCGDGGDGAGDAAGPPDLPLLAYVACCVASLPFGITEEPLTVVRHVNRIVALEAPAALSALKTLLTPESNVAVPPASPPDSVAPALPECPFTAGDVPGLGAAAAALCLLLKLKAKLRGAYGLNDAKVRAASATGATTDAEPLRVYDDPTLDVSGVPLTRGEGAARAQWMLLRRLMRDDADDYAGAGTGVGKRGRGKAVDADGGDDDDGGGGSASKRGRGRGRSVRGRGGRGGGRGRGRGLKDGDGATPDKKKKKKKRKRLSLGSGDEDSGGDTGDDSDDGDAPFVTGGKKLKY